LSGIPFVGAPTGRDSSAGRFARRNFEIVTYHTTRTESIENHKETLLSVQNAAESFLEDFRASHELNFRFLPCGKLSTSFPRSSDLALAPLLHFPESFDDLHVECPGEKTIPSHCS
jgi:hypothetical protein